MQIEFFHDVVCSFCYPMSKRMRQITGKYNNIDVVHRSFALGWEPDHYIQMFSSREAVKPELLTHWEQANQNDDDHRFNIEGMRKTDFNFPTSKNGLKAAKAAGIIGGQDAYWDAFDAIQNALFIENKNIEEFEILKAAIATTDIDIDQWIAQYKKAETEEAVLQDFAVSQAYGIQEAPALVINQKYLISGAQATEDIENQLKQIAEKEGHPLTPKLQTLGGTGMACSFVDGQWFCD
ncbi:MAG TPA: DsbA family protein [Aerococcus urinaeequi]|nr:DsbA family protein [Aerococcus urinaeequi]